MPQRIDTSERAVAAPITDIMDDVGSLDAKEKKVGPKRRTIRNARDFWDASLKNGQGGYGPTACTASSPIDTSDNARSQRPPLRARPVGN